MLKIKLSLVHQVKNTSKIQIEKVDSLQSAASLLSQPSPDKRSESEQSKDANQQRTKEITSTNSSSMALTNNTSLNKQPSNLSKELNNELAKKFSSSLNQIQQPSKSTTSKSTTSKSSSSANAINDKQLDKNKNATNSTNNNNRKIDLTTITPAPISKQVPTLSLATAAANDKRAPEKQVKESTSKLNLFANLYAPRIDKIFSINLKSSDQFKDCALVVENNLNNTDLCSLKLIDQDQNKLWQVIVSQKIAMAVSSNEIVCVCCEDDTVHVFNLQTGNRLSTPFLIPSSVSKLACFKQKVLIITIKAELWLWDLKLRKVIVKNVSLIPLIHNNFNQAEISLTNYCITSNGLPLITLSTGKTYAYDLDMETWHLLSNNQDLLNYSCDYKQKITSNVADYPLSLIQSQQRYALKLVLFLS